MIKQTIEKIILTILSSVVQTCFLRIIGMLLIPALLSAQTLKLEDIQIYGNVRTKPGVILRELCLKSDAPVDPSILTEDRDWLIRLDFLRRIEFLTKTGTAPDRETLLIVVSEKSLFSFSPSATWDDLFGISAGGTLSSDDFLGRRETLKIRARIGGIREGRIFWSEPWLAGSLRLFTELDAQYKGFRYLYGDFRPDAWLDIFQFRWALGRQFDRRLRIGIRSGWDWVAADNPDALVSGREADALWILSLFGDWDTRDWPFYPQRGAYAQAGLNRFALPDGRNLVEMDWDARAYLSTSAGNILALQTVLHVSDGPVPVYRRIHLGGSPLRGYPTGAFWGENSLTGCVEYRVPLIYERNPAANLHVGYLGVLFVDAGAAWRQSERIGWERFRGSAGVGLHAVWQRWVLRAEYGINGKGWGFLTGGTDVKF